MNNQLVRKKIMPHQADKEKEAGALRDALRVRLKNMRQALDPGECRAKSIAAQKAICAHELFSRADSIALYMPIKGEIGTELLFARALEAGKAVYLPRVSSNRQMEFARINSMDDLEPGVFGIPQPARAIRGLGPEEFAPDLMIVPGIAFDVAGHRLGFGGGYYDRFLGARRHFWPVAGLCFSFQLVDEIPSMPWDQGVDYIFDENGHHNAGLA